MAEGVTAGLAQFLSDAYANVSILFPGHYRDLFTLTIFALLISAYALIFGSFYRQISKRDLLNLNLSQYKQSEHPLLKKIEALGFYILEYIIVLPFIIFLWFAALAFVLILVSEHQTGYQILLVTAATIAAIRILAYANQTLSEELSKLFPLTALTFFIFTPDFFSVERLLDRLVEMPFFFTNALYFLGFIIILEFVLRLFEIPELLRQQTSS